MIYVLKYWRIDGFDFFEPPDHHFYFQSWISTAGILFTAVMAVTTYIIYNKTKLQSLKYIPMSFILIAAAYSVIGYHASYCKVCSDLGFCAASHNYPDYLMVITFVIFVLAAIMLSRNLDLLKKTESSQVLLYGLLLAMIALLTASAISLNYLEIPNDISYVTTSNLQVFVFIIPLVMILSALISIKNISKASGVYLLMAFLASLSFIPQVFHIYACKDCHDMECSEFYVFSGIIMIIVTGLLIHAIRIQVRETKELM
jgi:hypothetical protein